MELNPIRVRKMVAPTSKCTALRVILEAGSGLSTSLVAFLCKSRDCSIQEHRKEGHLNTVRAQIVKKRQHVKHAGVSCCKSIFISVKSESQMLHFRVESPAALEAMGCSFNFSANS